MNVNIFNITRAVTISFIDLIIYADFKIGFLNPFKRFSSFAAVINKATVSFAYRLSAKGDASFALQLSKKSSQSNLNDPLLLDRLSSIYRQQNHFSDSCKLAIEATNLRENYISRLGLETLNLRLFDNTFHPIGHTAIMDLFIKGQILGILPQRRNIVLFDRVFDNPHFLEHWKKYCIFITDKKLCDYIRNSLSLLEENISLTRCNDGTLLRLEELGLKVQQAWESKNNAPLITLDEEIKRKGYELLQTKKVPTNTWFCCLHVRNSIDSMRNVRNANILDYKLAIEEIANRGGWVFNIGNEMGSSPKLLELPNYLDFSNRPQDQSWIDLFLLAEGRFMIGTGSGPGAVPMCFNKPVAYTNWGPMRQRHWFKSDIYLPKQYKLITEERFLTLEERMSDHYGYQESISALRMLGVEVIDNSPEEIKELIIEMIEKTNGIQIFSPNQKEKNQYFQAVSLKNCVYPSNISKAFIDRYMIDKNTNTLI